MNRSSFTKACVLMFAVAVVASPAFAVHIDATLDTMDGTWPDAAVVDTGDPFDGAEPDYDSERDVKESRELVQSFQLPTTTEITDIYVAYQNPLAEATFGVRLYSMADVFAGDNDNPTLGTELFDWELTSPASVPAADGTHHVLKMSLPNPPTLTGKDGPSGYALMLFRPDADDVFQWVGERDVDVYAEGRAFSDSQFSWGSDDDFSLAIVPEPTTIALLSLGGLAALKRRK